MTSQPSGRTLAADVSPELFKEVMGSVCTPVSVVTALDGRRPHGTTVSAFCSLSLTPPMVMVALDEGSALLQLLRRSSRFGINVLGHTQDAVASQFAVKGDDKFTGVDWEEHFGAPRIAGSAGWFACDVEQLVPGGDHTVVLARVVAIGHAEHSPLTYHRRVFGTHAALERPLPNRSPSGTAS
jgi:flavin reductase (DIM6/NTAB) family NADH-FMN oxidoreductase RutF